MALTFSNLNNLAYAEGSGAVLIDSDITITTTGTEDFSGGYVDYSITSAAATEQLAIQSVASLGAVSTANGAVSVFDGTVYLGNGTSSTVVGTVDTVKNGVKSAGNADGALRINFSNAFVNGNFETDAVNATSVTGWTLGPLNQFVRLDGVYTIAGQPTPIDTTWPGPNSNRNVFDNVTAGSKPGEASIVSDNGGKALKLNTGSMSIDKGYGVVRGPYVYSNGSVALQAGDQIQFDWKAIAGGDAYDAYGYLLNTRTGATITILDETGTSSGGGTNWANKSVTVAAGQEGSYQFVFVAGSYDFTGGQFVGGALHIDNVVVTQQNPAPALGVNVIEQLTEKVTYENTATDFDVDSGTELEARTFNIKAVDGSSGPGNTHTGTNTINLSDENSSPYFTGPAMGDAGDENAPAAVSKTVAAWFSGTLFADPDNTLSVSDDELAGIVVTGNPTPAANGVWEYSLDSTDGTDGAWAALPAVTPGAGLALGLGAYLRYTPETTPGTHTAGTGTLQVHAVDNSGYTDGTTPAVVFTTDTAAPQLYDTTTDSDLFSPVSKDPSAMVAYLTSFNAAPIMVNASAAADLVTGTISPVPSLAPSWSGAQLYQKVGGTDAPDSLTRDTTAEGWAQGVAITSLATAGGGTFQYSTNGGATWTGAPVVSEGAALLLGPDALLRYLPDASDAPGDIGTFSYVLWDGKPGSGTSGGTADATARGNDTAFSADASAPITIQVTPPPSPVTTTATIESMSKDTGSSATDFITNDGSAGRTINGTLSAPLVAGEQLMVSFNGGANWQPATASGTTWSATDATAHTGDWQIQVRVKNATDLGATASQTVTLDTTAPTRAEIHSQTANTATPVITGSVGTGPLPAGETLTVTLNGATYSNVTVDANGTWSVNTATATATSGTLGAFVPGEAYDVVAVVTDTAGNSTRDNTGGEFRLNSPPAKTGPGDFEYKVPEGTFDGAGGGGGGGGGGGLTYTATVAPPGGTGGPGAGGSLPSWLVFDPATQTFSGNPPAGVPSPLVVRVTADDGSGNLSYADLTFAFSNTNDAPVISGVPAAPTPMFVGAVNALPDFTVADADNVQLSVTLTTSNGRLRNLTDMDPQTPGLQLTGTADEINAALAGMQFIPHGPGIGEVHLSATDGLVTTPTVASYQFAVLQQQDNNGGNGNGGNGGNGNGGNGGNGNGGNGNGGNGNGGNGGNGNGGNGGNGNNNGGDGSGGNGATDDNDNDGIAPAVEAQAPALVVDGKPAQQGDGNGDGIADNTQSNVTSTAFLKTDTSVSNPASAPQTFITLVADSNQGLANSASSGAQITALTQSDRSVQLPSEINSALGTIAATVAVNGSPTETFSLYVDGALQANGFWAQDNAGTWVNLASAPYGGQVVVEGNKLRLDFQITDGDQFDRDGKADGIITLQGEVGEMPLSIVGFSPEIAGANFWF